MAAPTHKVTVLETCLSAPPPGTVANASLPLTFCDMIWIGFDPIQNLLFYEFPVSNTHFVNHIIPVLKNSLSATLQHFWVLAGKLRIPLDPDSERPEIRYVDGEDSVTLAFAESDVTDLSYLTSNQPRNCSELHPLVPQLPPPPSSESSGSRLVPLLALQVTLFPGMGISVGLSYQHVAADGRAILSFLKAWGSFSKLGGGGGGGSVATTAAESIIREYLPFHDRSVMKVTSEIDEEVWKDMRSSWTAVGCTHDQKQLPGRDTDKVRATFVMGPDDIRKLKNYVSGRQPSVQHLSTFTVVCGYIWGCYFRSSADGNDNYQQDDDDDEIHSFTFFADCRGRSDPPIPSNYFGNCILICIVSAEKRVLSQEGGFPVAAQLIDETIKRFKKKEGVFSDTETLFSEFDKLKPERTVSIAGSNTIDFYDVRFGWGKATKYEFVSIDVTDAISLGPRGGSEGVEIGLSLPPKRMDAFALLFTKGLNELIRNEGLV